MQKLLFIILIICLFATFAFAQKASRNKNVINTKVLNSPLVILSQPKAPYPHPETGTVCISGVVRLKVRFLETGKIGDIVTVNSLPYGAVENSIEAAKKIKFRPAIKDGKPVTVSKILEYRFGLSGEK
jgi:outer membrane biosynthesis protein TonB